MISLPQLHAEIAARADSIRTTHPDWLCHSGCEGCCHKLADIPKLTADEWLLLRQGLKQLPPALLHDMTQAVAALSQHTSRPIVCPLLDRTHGTCQVYPYRPTACRSYGFYQQRDKGLYCMDIEAQVAGGTLNDVVWGNHEVIDRQLAAMGESQELTTWFAHIND